MLVFSATSLYLTSLWNSGFSINFEAKSFITITVAVAVLYYILTPLSKLLLFPLNLLTFGLFSIAVNSLLFYLIVSHFSTIISIKEWSMPHIQFLFVNVGPAHLSATLNLVVCAVSMYIIINLFEKLV